MSVKMTRSAALLLATAGLVSLLAVGCGAQEGETVFTAGPTNPDVGGKAPYTGTYTLYTAMSPNPTMTVKLTEGDPLGFRGAGDGVVEAYAGDQTHKFNKGTAQVYWKHVKD